MDIYIGIDWSQAKHDIAFLNDAMSVIAQLTIPHTPEGFLKLDATRQSLNVPAAQVIIGIETAYNLLIDFLWARGYRQVYGLPPNVVKSSRRVYRQTGARTDTSDAFLIANLLRMDRARFQVWCPDSPLPCQMRAKVSWFLHLTQMQVRLENRLRAVLLRYYPAAVEVFSHLAAAVTLEFLCAYPNPAAAHALTYAQFEQFAHRHHYPRLKKLPAAFARLQTPQPEAAPEVVAMYQDEAVQQAQLMLTVVQNHSRAEQDRVKLFQQHPDYETFHALPGAGNFLAPALLTKLGDDRRRFLTPQSVPALASTGPVTDQSGKRKVIRFRRACDHEFRHIAQEGGRHSLDESVWANAYFEQVRPHCKSESQAYRWLANRWLAIAWKLWQTHQRYDEAFHLKQRAEHSKPRGH